MTKKIISVSPDTPLLEAIQKLAKHRYNGLPVVDQENRLVGIITEYDLIEKNIFSRLTSLQILLQDLLVFRKYSLQAQEEISKISSLRVKDVMNSIPFTLGPTAAFNEVAKAFKAHHRVNPILIVDQENKLIGIVSRSDIFKSLRLVNVVKNLLLGCGIFLRKSIFSSPDDIERPYHKIVNLVLKISGIALVLIGFWLLQKSALEYFEVKNASITALEQEKIFKEVFALSLWGIGSILIAIFISLVLVLRYLAFTLPDRIYFRQYGANESKKESKQ